MGLLPALLECVERTSFLKEIDDQLDACWGTISRAAGVFQGNILISTFQIANQAFLLHIQGHQGHQ